jgi:hypothetical protein
MCCVRQLSQKLGEVEHIAHSPHIGFDLLMLAASQLRPSLRDTSFRGRHIQVVEHKGTEELTPVFRIAQDQKPSKLYNQKPNFNNSGQMETIKEPNNTTRQQQNQFDTLNSTNM